MKDLGPFYRQKNVQAISLALEIVISIFLSQFCHKIFVVDEFFFKRRRRGESKQTTNVGEKNSKLQGF